MSFELVVTEPFKLGSTRYARGDEITDQTVVAQVEKDFPRHFVRRAAKTQSAAAENQE